MRDNFIHILNAIAEDHDDLFLLTGDLGYKLFDVFRSNHPRRFFDVGVAESNMAGIAAGLALSGKTVYCYSIVPFLVMRAYEHIRVDIASQNLNVKLLGAGGGFTYGFEGFTHWGFEDMALMRVLPNMTVVAPSSISEARQLAKLSYQHLGPMYIRFDKSFISKSRQNETSLEIGKAITLREGDLIALFAIGNMVNVAIDVSEMLLLDGIKTTVINMHTLKPLDSNVISQIASSHEMIFSLEEHCVNGGLGSAIAESLAESGYHGFFRRIGIPETGTWNIGSAEKLRETYGLTAQSVYQRVYAEIQGST